MGESLHYVWSVGSGLVCNNVELSFVMFLVCVVEMLCLMLENLGRMLRG